MFLEFVQQQWPLFAALVIIVLSLIYSYVGDRLMGYRSVDPNQATRLINDGAGVLDVRTEAEFRNGHIADALNVPVSQLKSKLDRLPFDKKQPLVVYCQSGSRSARACALLAKSGFEQVRNLSGGIMAWQGAGMPLARGKPKSKGKKKAKKT